MITKAGTTVTNVVIPPPPAAPTTWAMNNCPQTVSHA
jgi:hypothetical protein